MATLSVADAASLQRTQPQPSTIATLSIADAFFLDELRATVGHRQACTWLSSTRAKAKSDRAHLGSSSSSTTSSSTPLARSSSPPLRRYHSDDVAAVRVPSRDKHDDPAAGAPSRARHSYSWSSGRAAHTPHFPANAKAPSTSEDDECVKRVLRTGGRDAGLVFTDAAHCVCDVRVSSFA